MILAFRGSNCRFIEIDASTRSTESGAAATAPDYDPGRTRRRSNFGGGFRGGLTGGLRESLRKETNLSLSGGAVVPRQLVNRGPKLWGIGLGQTSDVTVLERAAGGLIDHVADGTLRGSGNAASGHQEFVP